MHDPNETKRELILAAAYRVFTTYGYRRSNMADIAREAGMSRPALYQVFRNKEDIFRAYVMAMKAAMVASIRQAFDGEGAVSEKLYRALDGALLEPHRFIESTPHGEEIIGVKTEIASDLFDDWLAEVETALTSVFDSEVEAGRLDLSRSGFSEQALARLVVNAMEGIKVRMTSVAEGEKEVRALVGLVMAAAGKGARAH